jgi:hypothetical protein
LRVAILFKDAELIREQAGRVKASCAACHEMFRKAAPAPKAKHG